MMRFSETTFPLPSVLRTLVLLLVLANATLQSGAAQSPADSALETSVGSSLGEAVPVDSAPDVANSDVANSDVANSDVANSDVANSDVVSVPVRPTDSSPEAESSAEAGGFSPVVLVAIGIVSVLGLIIGLKLNAFLALIISALLVSLLGGGDPGRAISGVVDAFGSSAGGIGIVIAMAAIIGKCMLDSGSADRIVRSAVDVTGEKKASLGLMASGFVLAIPVFFDTVFYLLVPLARSLHRRTQRNYLRYLMAIATGGAITHTLVPPTPGPLLVGAILGVDIGTMMLIGAAVALPTACVGLLFSVFMDTKMPVPMRALSGDPKHQPLGETELPSLWVSLLPILLPVALIGAGTLASTLADREDRARLTTADIVDFEALVGVLRDAEADTPEGRLRSGIEKTSVIDAVVAGDSVEAVATQQALVDSINRVLLRDDFYTETAFLGVRLSPVAKAKLAANQVRMKPVDRRRMNRVLLEDALGTSLVRPHQWESASRKLADRLALWSNPNFALLLAAVCAMVTLKWARGLSWGGLSTEVEAALMSGGVIILITAAGGAFGATLQATEISEQIKTTFSQRAAEGTGLLLLAWLIAAVLKVAQGSSTVAMIVGAGMMSAIIGGEEPAFNLVYVATAVGAGSLMGSWMNDSGFWVFTKMGGLTESESLRSWTPLLGVLSLAALGVTILMSLVMPLV